MPKIGGGNIGGGTTTTGGALPWLVVNGTKVFEGAGGRQYRTTGWNNYVMKVAGGTTAQTMNATQRENFFAGLRPNSLVRVWFFAPVPPSYTWAQVLTELDAIVASAKKYGHRLIASLTGQAQAANDAFGGKTAAWYQARNWRTAVSGATSLEAWTKTVVARYANEPTVAIYDLCNEPNDTGGVFTADLTLYAQEMSGYVKGIAPNALTYMGVQYVSILGGQTQYQTVFANLDFCSSHFYDTTGHFTSKAGVVLAARALGKPLLIDEFGVWAKPFYGTPNDTDKDPNGLAAVDYEAQGRLTTTTMDAAFELPEVFGALLWSAMDSDATWIDTAGRFEPPNRAPASFAIRDARLNLPAGQLQDTVSSMQAWVDSVQGWRYAPGTLIGGPNSGVTIPNVIYDRGMNTNYRQATQANAPAAGRLTIGTTRYGTLQFTGASRYFHNLILTGPGTAHTLYAVVSPTAWPAAGAYGYILATNSTTAGFAVRINSAGLVELVLHGATPVVIGTSTIPLAVGRLWLVEVRWDAAGGTWRIRTNGSADATGNSVRTLASDIGLVGAEAAGTNGFTGHMLDLIKTGTSATPADQARFYAYFNSRYQLG
jgi:hypothetical protein